MTEDEKTRAIKSMHHAVELLDSGCFLAAEAWAEHAADLIQEANVASGQVTNLVAPRDGATTGDKVAICLSAAVLVWMVTSMMFGVWTL
jgi:hypothetical protein